MNFFRKLKDTILKFHRQGIAPREIAAGIAVGNFIAFVPIIGTHTILAVALASLLRLSPFMVILGAQISNPFTIPFQFFLCAEVGNLVLNGEFLVLEISRDINYLDHYILPIIVGSIVLGLAVSGVSYLLLKIFFEKRKALNQLGKLLS